MYFSIVKFSSDVKLPIFKEKLNEQLIICHLINVTSFPFFLEQEISPMGLLFEIIIGSHIEIILLL